MVRVLITRRPSQKGWELTTIYAFINLSFESIFMLKTALEIPDFRQKVTKSTNRGWSSTFVCLLPGK